MTTTIYDTLRQIIDTMPRGTQAQLARELGVVPQTVSKWLKGEVDVPIVRWLEIERSLGLKRLTLARRVGLLNNWPELEEAPDDQVEDMWLASFAVGDERRQARSRIPHGGYLLDEHDFADEINKKLAEHLNRGGLAGIPDRFLEMLQTTAIRSSRSSSSLRCRTA